MIELNEENLNKYIDGELSDAERAELEKKINASKEFSSKFKIMTSVDKQLRHMEAESPSPLFTQNVMSKLKGRTSFSKAQNRFIIFIGGFITLLCLGVTYYVIKIALNMTGDAVFNIPDLSSYWDNFSSQLTSFFRSIALPKYFTFIGSLASFVILISGYFFFESFKNYKKLTKQL